MSEGEMASRPVNAPDLVVWKPHVSGKWDPVTIPDGLAGDALRGYCARKGYRMERPPEGDILTREDVLGHPAPVVEVPTEVPPPVPELPTKKGK